MRNVNSRYVVTNKPDCDVVPLSDMKLYLKVSTNSDDILIKSLLDSAVILAEKFMNRDILTTTYQNYRDSFYQDLTLTRGGFQSLVSIEYLKDGVYQSMAVDDYKASIGGVYGEICNLYNIPTIDCDCNAVRITFKTGFSDDGVDVPEAIKTAIKSYVAFMYENRGDCGGCATGKSGFPVQAEALLSSYKIIKT